MVVVVVWEVVAVEMVGGTGVDWDLAAAAAASAMGMVEEVARGKEVA